MIYKGWTIIKSKTTKGKMLYSAYKDALIIPFNDHYDTLKKIKDQISKPKRFFRM